MTDAYLYLVITDENVRNLVHITLVSAEEIENDGADSHFPRFFDATIQYKINGVYHEA